MEFPEDLTGLSEANLTVLQEQGQAAIAEFMAVTNPTAEQLEAAERVEAGLNAVAAEHSRREDVANRAAALRERVSASSEPEQPEETPAEEPEATEQTEQAEAPVEQPAETPAETPTETAPETPVAETPAAPEAVAPPVAAAVSVPRPVTPGARSRTFTLTTAPDVPGRATGSRIADIEELASAVLDRFDSFGKPNGTGETEDWRRFGLAQLDKHFPEELTIQDWMSPDQTMEVLTRATDEHNVGLTGQTLLASGGWCAPSEVAYGLTEGESTDGILSLPEVAVGRGGVKFTLGPDWSDVYGSSAFFAQTEAQAISGTTKSCFEVTCPTFTEVRLDVVGFCVKAPVLTNAAYPELVQRWLRGIAVAHQHKKNARRIAALQTLLGAATTAIDAGTTVGSLLGTLEFLRAREIEARRRPLNTTYELVLPFVAMPVLKQDFRLRNNLDNNQPVTDQRVIAELQAAGFAPQFVVGYQDLATNAVAYPATIEVMMYEAGTFVEGTSNVLSIGTMYDAASLATNVYTAAFFEEGQSFMKMKYGGLRTAVNVCSTGRLGALDLTCA